MKKITFIGDERDRDFSFVLALAEARAF